MALEMNGYSTISTGAYTRLNSTDQRERRLLLSATINVFLSFDNGATSQVVLFSETASHLLDLGIRKPCDVYVQPTFSSSTMRASLFSLDPGESR